MTVARTDATGTGELDPLVLAFTASLPVDRALYAADIAGSLAHVRMLEESAILSPVDSADIRRGLRSIYDQAVSGNMTWPDEEDIHMSVEVELTRRVGEPGGRLHTARSRNDQNVLDERLFLRECTADLLNRVAPAIEALVEKARSAEGRYLLPAYTHRQRAQPVSLAYVLSAYGQMLARDAVKFSQVLEALDECPLGAGAVSGSSLPIRRERTAELLGFARVTANALDTVGDRDYGLDFLYAGARCMLHLSRICQDLVDFASQEFGFIELSNAISYGSSMMPQKKNPDLFELIRGKSGRALGALTALCTTVKGLPVGFMLDLQEDKTSYLETAAGVGQSLDAFVRGLAGIRFRQERMAQALIGGETQATDLAERLVARGLPFRTAYKAVGALVRVTREKGIRFEEAGPAELEASGGVIRPEDLEVLAPARAVAAKESLGGTGPRSVERQLEGLSAAATAARDRARAVPRLAELIQRLT
ncbi:MAG TPA: argininosuccinate lyase [Myxococcaceae bacterium]|nr:argininosuccinate lyase [Myxococcaceae bacterium]